ncbi:lambda family phage holin [Erwinia persicina]|jgi:lambda family phage holin|uniref:Phage holin, lambda family n=1 Tax=Erwinia aeris TaxID=3239803 RepID=A0ABV4E9G2_9GAMM|nr:MULTISPECIES: phage holin, lambda family [Erwinia]MCP1440030.1 lambda family phage holin [Erwinia persicina]MDN4627679.1 phage holin, lambda family [Erwinia sp. PsM31]MDN8543384.1 phage holin, lambda family [Erwinia sp. BC051422]RRZ90923.1 phage holin, lambda family [Erwinia sp. 198]
MFPQEPGFWASVGLWLYSHKTEWGYAGIAAMFSLLRSACARTPWSKRVLDAVSCSALAFFAAPTLQVIGALLNWNMPEAAAQVFAVYIGYVGNDYISEKLKRWINKRTGEPDGNQP